MTLNPKLNNNHTKRERKRKRRSDKKFRIRLYMSAEKREELEEKALEQGSYFTRYASEMIEKVCQYSHRNSISEKEIETRETHAYIKLNLEDYTKIRQYANEHKCTYETAVYTFFKYAEVSKTKVKADEHKAFIKEEEDDFLNNKEVKIVSYQASEGVVIY